MTAAINATQRHSVHAVISKPVARRGLLPGQTATKLVLLTEQRDARNNGLWLAGEGPWERSDAPVSVGSLVELNGAVYVASRPREQKHYRGVGAFALGVWAGFGPPPAPAPPVPAPTPPAAPARRARSAVLGVYRDGERIADIDPSQVTITRKEP